MFLYFKRLYHSHNLKTNFIFKLRGEWYLLLPASHCPLVGEWDCLDAGRLLDLDELDLVAGFDEGECSVQAWRRPNRLLLFLTGRLGPQEGTLGLAVQTAWRLLRFLVFGADESIALLDVRPLAAHHVAGVVGPRQRDGLRGSGDGLKREAEDGDDQLELAIGTHGFPCSRPLIRWSWVMLKRREGILLS